MANVSAEERKILGKKVKSLRKEGKIPANIFGKGFKSKALQLTEADFRKLYKEVGETGVLDVKLGKESYPALVHKIQFEPRTDAILHVDFHKVNLKEKISTHVPIVLEGEAPAEKTGIGLILQTINELEIESLPGDIPHEIKVDMSKLEEIGQSIHVKDLKIDSSKVEVKNDPEETIVTVQTAEMKEEEPAQEVSPEEVEATSEKGEAEEGEEKKEEEKKEEPTQEPPEGKPQEQS